MDGQARIDIVVAGNQADQAFVFGFLDIATDTHPEIP
jgi:hypothetical protein